MKISIAMATYNGAQYLEAQLQSFIDQSRQPDELVITDDCSSDGTEAIIRKFAETAPFKVEYSCNEQNLGYCGNFNAALMKTTGDLVFLSDQDDVWFPEKIEYMLGVAELYPEALVVMNDAALTDSELNEAGLNKIGQIRSAGLSLSLFVMGCCAAVRRELLDFSIPIPAGFKAHDNWLVEIADALNAKVVEEKVLQYYRRHESNESQFIANRVTKVTRSQEFLHTLKGLYLKDAPQKLKEQIEQHRIFAKGIQHILENAPMQYHKALLELQNAKEKNMVTIIKRISVREKWLLPRMVATLRLLANGGYRNTSGLKSVLRDIIVG